MSKEQTFSGRELAEKLRDLPNWSEENGAITRTFETDGWSTTMLLVNLVAFYAEAADHHPDLAVSWPSVTVRLNTHSAGGITAKDIELARVIEQQANWRSAGGALTGTTKKWIKRAQ